jgi:hypothetical protein
MEQNLDNLLTNFKPKETNFNNKKTNKYFNKDSKSGIKRHHKKSGSRNSLYLFNTYTHTSTKKVPYKVPAKLIDDDDIDFDIDKLEKELNFDTLDDNMLYYKLTRYTSNTESILYTINFELVYEVIKNYEELINLSENRNNFLIEFNTVFTIIEKWFDLSGIIYNSEVKFINFSFLTII